MKYIFGILFMFLAQNAWTEVAESPREEETQKSDSIYGDWCSQHTKGERLTLNSNGTYIFTPGLSKGTFEYDENKKIIVLRPKSRTKNGSNPNIKNNSNSKLALVYRLEADGRLKRIGVMNYFPSWRFKSIEEVIKNSGFQSPHFYGGCEPLIG